MKRPGPSPLQAILSLLLCGMLLPLPSAALGSDEPLLHLGVCIYNRVDTFIFSLLDVIQEEADGLASLTVVDAQNDQNTQNDQVEQLLSDGVDALIVNPVDRTTAIYLLQMAMRYEKPIVFINREPLREDLALYSNAYYVGIDPKEQGTLSGQLAAEYFTQHPQADRNGDGVMQLVILKGEPGHQDAELRTQYAMKALQESGIPIERLQEEAAMWQRSLGQERMVAMLNTHGDRIEVVLSNNDDMALGAIDALKAADYFTGGKYMPVIGIDATSPALEALEQGALYATVRNDAEAQGRAALQLALLLAQGLPITADSFPYALEDKVVYIPSTTLITPAEP